MNNEDLKIEKENINPDSDGIEIEDNLLEDELYEEDFLEDEQTKYGLTDEQVKEFDPKRKRPCWVELVIYILIIASAFFAGRYIQENVFKKVEIRQTSMNATLEEGDVLYINRLSSPTQFSIIVFCDEEISSDWLIKRVIATGGQEIEIADGILYITENGETKAYIEEYVYGENVTIEKTYVPEGYIYVLGDNRSVSKDSEDYGPVLASTMIGKAMFVNSEEAVLIE